MDKFWWHAAWGLCLVPLSLAQIDLNITCRFAGVFHVEKNGRYSISRTEAADLCKAFNSTLPTMAQMEKALSIGFETCRYGFIEGHVVIPRIHPNSICAANNTGVYILTSNTSQYDTYCFNASAPPEEDCTSVTDLPNAFDGPITITIVNRDGTRYVQKGEYRTNPEDIYPSNPTDDDVSSGSSSERSSTSGSYIFYTFSTVHSIPDEDGPWITDSTDRTPATRDQDAFHPSGGSHTTHGSESAGHSRGSQEGGANTTSGPIRTPQIPEWLIILASLLALALILAVCIAVNSRRRCGQKKKLVINSGNGAVEDRKPSGLNGEASKSQEMVHLVNKESSETPDQFITADETRNLQNVDMKIGV
uniref:CD44 antigen n=1 Tax=Nomascus leucogenys TaxID=61853 RepID=M3Z972_NOMLE